jgi:hypothetical protein
MSVPRFLRSTLFGGATVVLVGCGDGAPAGVDAQGLAPEALLADAQVRRRGLVPCSRLPSVSVTQTIGPAGGFLQVGPHLLSVPPGALVEPVSIRAKARSRDVNRVSFKPEGLTFQRPVLLTMSYANCGVLGVLLPKRIAHTDDDDDDDDLKILEFLPSADDLVGQEVTGVLRHFSDYAVAW